MVIYDSDSDYCESVEREKIVHEDLSTPASPAVESVVPISSLDSTILIATTPKKTSFFDAKDNNSNPLTGKDFAKLSRAWESKATEEISTIQDDVIKSRSFSQYRNVKSSNREAETAANNTQADTTVNNKTAKSRTGRFRNAGNSSATTGSAAPVKLSFHSTAPQLEVETGFAARVYAELLDVKKQIQQLQKDRHQLRTTRRKAQRELLHEKRKYEALLQSNGNLCVHRKYYTVSHLGAYRERETRQKTFRPTGTNNSPTRSELEHVATPPQQGRERIESINGRIVSETARVIAYKRRLVSMHNELQVLTAAITDCKSKSAYTKYERLSQLMESLEQQAFQLRETLKRKTTVDSAKATAAAVQKSRAKLAQKDSELDKLKVTYKEYIERIRKLQSELTIASQKVEAQADTSEKLAAKVEEARTASKSKRDGLPEEKKRLTERLKQIEEHIILQTEKLNSTKQNGERELEMQRENLKKNNNIANHLKSEYEERERALERDRQVVKKMKEALRLHQNNWSEEEAILEGKCEAAKMARGSDTWASEKKELEDRIESLRSELNQIETDKTKSSLEHQQKLTDIRSTADARQQVLMKVQTDS